MKLYSETISLNTKSRIEFIDITEQIKKVVEKCGVKNGFVLVHTTHTTTALWINENEKYLLEDMKSKLEEFAPFNNNNYLHDNFSLRECSEDERINADAHLRTCLFNTNQSIPVIEGNIVLGKYQNILFIELDGPRKRKLVIQVVGEED